MTRPDLGVREYVALGALCVALAFGIYYLGANADGGGPTGSVSSPLPVATREPVTGSRPWLVTFFDTSSGTPTAGGQSPVDTLDFDFAGAPFPDFRDDHWALLARKDFDGPAGSYILTIHFTGEIHVSIDGKDLAVTPAKGKGTAAVPITHGDVPTVIIINMTDAGGPFQLQATLAKA